MALNDRDKLFAELYIKHHFNARAAYLELQPACKNPQVASSGATRIMRKEGFHEYLYERVDQIKHESGLVASQQEVLEFFTDVMRGKLSRKRDVVAGIEVVTVEDKPGVNESLRAADSLAKVYGLNRAEQTVELGDNATKAISDMTMAERITLLREAVREVDGLDDS